MRSRASIFIASIVSAGVVAAILASLPNRSSLTDSAPASDAAETPPSSLDSAPAFSLDRPTPRVAPVPGPESGEVDESDEAKGPVDKKASIRGYVLAIDASALRRSGTVTATPLLAKLDMEGEPLPGPTTTRINPETGFFDLGVLPAGIHRLSASVFGEAEFVGPLAESPARAKELLTIHTPFKPESGLTLEVFFRVPCPPELFANVQLITSSNDTLTAQLWKRGVDASYVFAKVPNGPSLLTVDDPRFHPVSMKVDAAKTPALTVKLEWKVPLTKVRLRATDQSTGQPVARHGFTFEVVNGNTPFALQLPAGVSDVKGVMVLDNVPNHFLGGVVSTPGYARGQFTVHVASDPAEPRDGSFLVQPLPGLRGRVVHRDGVTPCAHLYVYLFEYFPLAAINLGRASIANSMADADGVFSLPVDFKQRRNYQVLADFGRGVYGKSNVVDHDGISILDGVTIVKPAAARLRGKLSTRTHVDLSNLTVVARTTKDRVAYAYPVPVSPGGEFVFDPIADGLYSLFLGFPPSPGLALSPSIVNGPGSSVLPGVELGEVHVDSGIDREVSYDIDGHLGVSVDVVVKRGGNPFPNVLVRAERPGGTSAATYALTDARGRARLGPLPRERHLLAVLTPSQDWCYQTDVVLDAQNEGGPPVALDIPLHEGYLEVVDEFGNPMTFTPVTTVLVNNWKFPLTQVTNGRGRVRLSYHAGWIRVSLADSKRFVELEWRPGLDARAKLQRD
jgi:hypothetical protein